MSLDPKVRQFVAGNHKAVFSTFRRDGATQMSVVTCGPYGEGVAFSTTEDRAKLRNLERDTRCTLLVSKDDWWGYIVFEGRAEIISSKTASPEKLRDAMRDVYRAASGTEHPDWEEYDEAMRKENRATVIVIPDKVYGTAL